MDLKKTITSSQTPLINSWLQIPSSFIAEIFAKSEVDLVTIDMQHGLIDYSDLVPMLQAIASLPVLVRVPWNEPRSIMKALDAGAAAIICPMINTKSEAERFVKTCKYPPQGYRSYGPIRANLSGTKDYVQQANTEILTLAQIETEEAMDNLDDILAVDGLDGVYVGTIDLSISMGLEKHGKLSDPRLEEAVRLIGDKVKNAGKISCIHTMNPDDIPKVNSWGYHVITPLNDVSILKNQIGKILSDTRQLL